MANQKKCLTPDTHFTTVIEKNKVSIEVRLPFELDIDKNEAIILETLLHSQIELVLWKYFQEKQVKIDILTKILKNPVRVTVSEGLGGYSWDDSWKAAIQEELQRLNEHRPSQFNS